MILKRRMRQTQKARIELTTLRVRSPRRDAGSASLELRSARSLSL
jgi:hypothetical protein